MMFTIKKKRAQTAVELAVFGAILIFVLGVIIRSSLSRGYQQHAALRATRMAMTASLRTSASHEIASRNFASVLIVEDRLTAGSAKYGEVDRVPFMTPGTGVHSSNLFMPVDFGDSEDLPVMDVYVNGKRFVFTTASFKTVELAHSCRNASPCPAECNGDCEDDSPQYYPGADLDPADWQPNCATATVTTTLSCAGADAGGSPCPDECGGDCSAASVNMYTETSALAVIGCARLYTIADNHPLVDEWCDNKTSDTMCPAECSATPEPGCNLSLDERFDLDRDGIPDVPEAEREGFAWQWYLVLGYNERQKSSAPLAKWRLAVKDPSGTSTTVTARIGEGIIFEEPWCKKHCQKAKNVVLDADGDLKQESIMPEGNETGAGGIITKLAVRDPNGGDVDYTVDDGDERRGVPRPGFTRDVNIYTFVRDSGDAGGTYLRIDEGKLFSGDGKQYIRTASKKDQIDVIERLFRLSNNTGRYCDGSGNPTDWSDGGNPLVRGEYLARLTNPVEVCGSGPGECFLPANMARTCMDTKNLIIFMRSRPIDVHGRKWVTDVSGDPYVDFEGE